MLRVAALASLVLVLACSKAKDVTADIEALSERACACTDAACAERVVDDLISFAEAHRRAGGNEKRAGAAARKLGQCAVEAGMDVEILKSKLQRLQEL